MNSHILQEGELFVCPLTLPCQNSRCAGELYLVQAFNNFQELWRCDKCHVDAWMHTIDAHAEKLADSGEIISKNCAYCKMAFTTYDPGDDVCEACSMFQSWGYPN